MLKIIKYIVKNTFKTFGYDTKNLSSDFKFLSKFPFKQIPLITTYLKHSTSQLRQDLLVLALLNFKWHGFFVEFGATDGIFLSNTFLLEKKFRWSGILAEPAQCWHNALQQNRNCIIDTRCIWSKSDLSIPFKEVDTAEYSTIAEYTSSDSHKEYREIGKTYEVKTISLLDLLDNYNAPKIIDYLGIDTEGSEYEIL